MLCFFKHDNVSEIGVWDKLFPSMINCISKEQNSLKRNNQVIEWVWKPATN